MKITLVTAVVAALGLAASPALFAQGCCEGGVMKEGCMVKIFERNEFSKERLLRAMIAED